ncbi:hypothetical protein [Longimicrobium terrae]|uniref:Uncharacterized protein n=1 Tax=Longimicrobium terrae TaxID=1639882 RepID=A0A841H7C1_9BACT|nr:hypothetical protein [Longimicrobium terrae]MBB4639600.1 hypothetical protein [Longimicrobium terrae]MBB6073997.1 hypothetical protein [Longimicrobium terrae]NNC28317.1 hypothetical protein [Longimicrobium terrae]
MTNALTHSSPFAATVKIRSPKGATRGRPSILQEWQALIGKRIPSSIRQIFPGLFFGLPNWEVAIYPVPVNGVRWRMREDVMAGA